MPSLPATADDTVPSWAAVCGTTCVVVGIPCRKDFDRIALPAVDGGLKPTLNTRTMREEPRHVLSKHCFDPSGVTVVFQHWGVPVDADSGVPACA